MLLYQEIYFVCATDKTVFLILNTFLFSSADMRLILVPQTSLVRRALLLLFILPSEGGHQQTKAEQRVDSQSPQGRGEGGKQE